jgi:hypothetical protein
LPLQYKTALPNGEVTGLGLTVNLSNTGVLFQTADPPPGGSLVELSIAWPGRGDDSVVLMLYIIGHTVRTVNVYSAIAIERHEFRTSSKIR